MPKKIYFLSDLHLGAPYFPDSREAELRVVGFLDSIAREASEIYLLGDILDYWYEYRYVVPKGFVRFFGKLAELSDSGVKITWLIGNHDIWLFDYLPEEIGLEVADGPIVREIGGEKFYMAHGDGLGKTKASFRFLRALFRNKTCQWLYSGIHPRWTVPFAQRWSRSSRKNGMKSHARRCDEMVDRLRQYSDEQSRLHPEIDYFLYGHLHVVAERELNDGKAKMMVLGDWITNFSYAVYTPATESNSSGREKNHSEEEEKPIKGTLEIQRWNTDKTR